jgi:GH25 family lysozyme M1 (1,4-beta-N-acetylmuramidase)
MPIPATRPRRSLARSALLAALALSVALPASRAGAEPVRDGFAGSSGEAALMTARSGERSRVGPTTPGLDVSHWQGTVNWTKVARAGRRFVFLKATDDVDYRDPTFVTNRAGARSNGLLVGAYHFARPDPSPGDARQEALFFVSVANPQPGDLLPVLDMETKKHLDQEEVTRWARAWVAEVRELTGVTPLVYTSPYGWLTRTGDTRLLARDGAPLWVAHWGVSSPTVPAGDWDGHGWVVWQHTSSGHVRGISGRVDLDRLAGHRLGRITIRRLSVEVSGGAGRVTSLPAGLGCASSCSRSVDPDRTVTLTAVPDASAYFTGWTGACTGSDPTCTIRMRGNRAVGARFVTDITPPTATIAVPANFVGPVVARFDEDVRGVTAGNIVLREQGGSRLAVDRVCRSGSGRRLPCDATTVRSVALVPQDPLVPGRDYEAAVNPAAADALVKDRVGNAADTTVQPFEAPRSVEQSGAPVRRSGTWSTVEAGPASGGTYAVTGERGAAAGMRFDGTGVDWITVTGPNRGRAQVYVDGERVRMVDLYAPVRTYGVALRFDGLTDGSHTLRIVATGHARRRSSGSWIAIDRFDVLG